MRRWKSESTFGRWFGVALLIALIAAAIYPAQRIISAFRGSPEQWQINLALYGWIVLFGAIALLIATLIYRIAAAFTLRYELDRNGLYIIWLGNRAIVPLDQITSIDIGTDGLHMPWRILQGIGYYWGQARGYDDRPFHLFSTRSPRASLLVHTETAAYVVSPEDREGFTQDLEQLRNLGSMKAIAPTVEPGRMFMYAFWNDRTVRLFLIMALLLNLLILGVLMLRYPTLPALLEMRFDATGETAELRPRSQILFIPMAAFALTLLNLAFGAALFVRQQISARMLQGASVIVQIMFLIALISIIS